LDVSGEQFEQNQSQFDDESGANLESKRQVNPDFHRKIDEFLELHAGPSEQIPNDSSDQTVEKHMSTDGIFLTGKVMPLEEEKTPIGSDEANPTPNLIAKEIRNKYAQFGKKKSEAVPIDIGELDVDSEIEVKPIKRPPKGQITRDAEELGIIVKRELSDPKNKPKSREMPRLIQSHFMSSKESAPGTTKNKAFSAISEADEEKEALEEEKQMRMKRLKQKQKARNKAKNKELPKRASVANIMTDNFLDIMSPKTENRGGQESTTSRKAMEQKKKNLLLKKNLEVLKVDLDDEVMSAVPFDDGRSSRKQSYNDNMSA
jgi:hypothetical protein